MKINILFLYYAAFSYSTFEKCNDSLQQQVDNILINGNWAVRENDAETLVYQNQRAFNVHGYYCNNVRYHNGHYLWKPRDTIFQYTKENLCEVINNRNIYIVGDSLSMSFFMTLGNMLWMNSRDLIQAKYCVNKMLCPEHIPDLCSNRKLKFRFSAFFVREYHLSLYNSDNTISRSRFELKSWVNILKYKNDLGISIVILNRGSHYTEDTVLIKQLNETFTYLGKHHSELIIIFRDTPSGHPHCEQYFNSTPFSSFHFNYSSLSIQQQELWKWDKFEYQNKLIRNLILQYHPYIIFMDVSHSTALRADSHKSANDCLHYCVPGPIDHWVTKMVDILNVLNVRKAMNCT